MMRKDGVYQAFEVLYWCGLRLGELLALTPSDFNFTQDTIRINKSLQRLKGKNVITEPKTMKSIRTVSYTHLPGVGKTTLARIIANQTKAKFINFSAVTSGIKDIRAVMKQAQEVQDLGEKTIVFVDEIHRFNKAQQDAFLPYIEQGSIILIGATTENPSFEINSALLSRCKVFVLKALTTDDLFGLLHYALISPKGFKDQNVMIDDDLLYMIAGFSNGDARVALNTLEMAVLNGAITHDRIVVDKETIEQCINQKSLLYDKKGEEHYNICLLYTSRQSKL